MKFLGASIESNVEGGAWQVFFDPAGRSVPAEQAPVANVTFFRNAPTDVLSVSSTDPFGPATAQVTFPRITYFDSLGSDDLWWCTPEANVDIYWVVADQIVYAWEGFAVSFDFGTDGLTVTCQGAMHQLDHYLAKPAFLFAPLPFERAIVRQFDNRSDLRMTPPRVEWPSWWDTFYTPDPALYRKPWMQPAEVSVGAPWSAMLTRDSGSWSQVLTGYIQQLLGSMHTDRGQFTLMLDRGRQPVLRHRDRRMSFSDDMLLVDLLTPGVDASLTVDHSQKLNAVFATGRALSGATFSGMRVSNDGRYTQYKPAAHQRQVWPTTDNPWLDRTRMLREVQLTAPDGMSEYEALEMAKNHLQRYSAPGVTGSITLRTDPSINGTLFPRQAIAAGMSLGLSGLFGRREPTVFHITDASFAGDSATLTVDTHYRDQLTVSEVRLRGRDALTPTRLLTTGQWQPNVPDLLFPWSYEIGAGYIPQASQALFRGIDTFEEFPWRGWVKAHPPKDPQWRDCYIRIGPKSANANQNWNAWVLSTTDQPLNAHPVLLSAAGQAKLIEVAAYDRDGNVLPVSFHISLYKSNDVNAVGMPKIQAAGGFNGYPQGQPNPFFPGAWETVDEDGVAQNPLTPQAEGTASMIVGWGNGYERAGYWPNQSSNAAAAKTGLFRDESGFSWDLIEGEGTLVNPQEPADVNTADPSRATVYVMVYCDDQAAKEVFFLGRIYRAEPGVA